MYVCIQVHSIVFWTSKCIKTKNNYNPFNKLSCPVLLLVNLLS